MEELIALAPLAGILDTPASIDPFTYVADPIPQHLAYDPTPLSAVPRHLAPQAPSTPSPSQPSSTSFIDDSPLASTTSSHAPPSSSKKSPAASSSSGPVQPKKPFPPEHLPAFLTRISRSTKTAVLLAVELKEMFRPLGVRQNQVDWELKRRAKRDGRKEGSRWIVGEQDWVRSLSLPLSSHLLRSRAQLTDVRC